MAQSILISGLKSLCSLFYKESGNTPSEQMDDEDFFSAEVADIDDSAYAFDPERFRKSTPKKELG